MPCITDTAVELVVVKFHRPVSEEKALLIWMVSKVRLQIGG